LKNKIVDCWNCGNKFIQLRLLSDNKRTLEQQDVIIEVVKKCFE